MKQIFAALSLIAALAFPAHASEVGDDGLHKQSWFSLTFRDIKEDIQAAKSEGKRLAIIIEQRGCIYCRKLHEDVLSDPEVANYIKSNFKIVQYNMFGDEEVTDLDGKSLTEKTAIRRWGLIFTPTVMFMPEDPPKSGTAKQASVAVMPGAFGKGTVLDMFEWVRIKGYTKDEPFQKYHARRLNERRAAKKPKDKLN